MREFVEFAVESGFKNEIPERKAGGYAIVGERSDDILRCRKLGVTSVFIFHEDEIDDMSFTPEDRV